MRISSPKGLAPAPMRRDVSRTNSPAEQSSRDVSIPGTVQNSVYGSAHDMEVHSAIAEFASKYFRYDSRIIMSLFVFI